MNAKDRRNIALQIEQAEEDAVELMLTMPEKAHLPGQRIRKTLAELTQLLIDSGVLVPDDFVYLPDATSVL